ncbi:mitogen-activated protein kinase kinase kinase 5-like [Neltuma alba]|uniref:mitogen-activated protein kinase kinase kinase 5-like n=1 Tax=Neltuma alba TaxID=207710 RepID=UPI0010A5632B|nr:mitogen-activated protein kinase kinase kinase 5-like [Prosopis alba]
MAGDRRDQTKEGVRSRNEGRDRTRKSGNKKNLRRIERDIKPDNLLVDSNNNLKLVDFGLAKHLAKSVGKHSQLGTPYYAAPEVLQKIEYKSSLEAFAADIWSLGCVIIEMFSGEHPWPGLEWQQAFCKVCINEEHPPIPEGLCEDGKDFLELCFTRAPAQRPSAAALLRHPFVKAQNNLTCRWKKEQ